MNLRSFLLLACCLSLLALVCCGKDTPQEKATSGTTELDVSSPSYGIVNMLRATKNKVEVIGDTLRPFFTPRATVITVDGSIVQLYEYSLKEELEKEATKVSSDGGRIGASTMKWEVPPHFYRTDKVIVLYEGDDSATKQSLANAVGSQFAGTP